MPEKFNELLLKPDIIELYNAGITPNYGYLMNGRFEKDMIKTSYPLKTLSGNPISWEASGTEYLFPVVSLEPKQAGSGDPSPENVRPISGWDRLQVTRCGKNLCPYGTQTFTKTHIESFGRFMPAGTYTFSATATSDDTEYTTCLVFFFNTIENKGVVSKQINRNARDSFTVDVTSPFDSIYLYASVGSTQSEGKTATFSDIQLELGSTPTDYEPYQGDTYDIALPETVYGGTVDAVTGVGSKTWGYIASYNGESLPGEWISDRDVYSLGTTPTTGAQVAYKLATPEPFQATGNRQLTSLTGYNTIYTNGDSMTLNRKIWRLEV